MMAESVRDLRESIEERLIGGHSERWHIVIWRKRRRTIRNGSQEQFTVGSMEMIYGVFRAPMGASPGFFFSIPRFPASNRQRWFNEKHSIIDQVVYQHCCWTWHK
jgi:hypothetical protein